MLLLRKVMAGLATHSQKNSSGNTYITRRVEYILYYLIQLWRYVHYSTAFVSCNVIFYGVIMNVAVSVTTEIIIVWSRHSVVNSRTRTF